MQHRLLFAAFAATMAGGASASAPGPDTDPLICRAVPRGAEVQIAQAHAVEGTKRDATTPAELDADLMEKVGLLEGHLMIGRALLEAGEQRLAIPHFGHPVQELYTWLEPRIASRRAPPFEAELTALEARAKANDKGPAFTAAWDAVTAKVGALKGSVAKERATDTNFMVDHVATMVADVAGDYGESIERGRITNILEYHDSAGFLRYATAVAQAQHDRAPAVWDGVLAELETIRKSAYAELLPPARPPVSISSVRSHADKIRTLIR